MTSLTVTDTIITQALSEGRLLLSEVESKNLLVAEGIAVTDAQLASDAGEAALIAESLGYPVVMKIISPDIAHKSDVGGVVVGLTDSDEVKSAYDEMMRKVSSVVSTARIEGVSVQTMAKPGIEVIVGATTDPQFGPVMMFGLGGVFVEVLKDVSFRVVPLEPRDAKQMVREIDALPILEGIRGQDGADLEALEDLLLSISKLIERRPEIAELDLNPVFAYSDGAIAVDARIVLHSQDGV
jgi:acetyl-CoA synthetase (ADP-forming)